MSTAHYYQVSVDWTEGRKGVLTAPGINDNIVTATPPEFAKGVPGIWSPEHLLVAAVNSCLMTTFLAIAENSKLEFESFTSSASGKLEIVDGKYMISQITLMPIVKIADESQTEKTLKLLQKSENACLISNSLKSEIIFVPQVQVSAPAHI